VVAVQESMKKEGSSDGQGFTVEDPDPILSFEHEHF
jgi:hypothetical protein